MKTLRACVAALLGVLTILFSPISPAHGTETPPSTPAPPPARSFWLTPDNDGGKQAHMGFSAVIGLGLRLHDREAAWWNRTGWCMVPGAAKELLDYASGSGVSRRDLRSNLLGCLGGVQVGSGLLRLTIGPERTAMLSWQRPLN